MNRVVCVMHSAFDDIIGVNSSLAVSFVIRFRLQMCYEFFY